MKSTFKKFIVFVLQLESRLILWKYKPQVIAITGSVGKTSTKDAIYAVLSGVAHVRKSEKSYNSEIGLPLTIIGIPNGWNNPLVWFKNIMKGLWLFLAPHKYPKWLILEVGIGKPGDMHATTSWLKNDVVIITAIGDVPVHIEFFNSRKHLIEEKAGLIKTLRKNGLLVLNSDDEAVIEMKSRSKHRTVTYGFKEGADILGGGESIAYSTTGVPQGIVFRIDTSGSSLPVVIDGVFGKNHVYASLAALAMSYGLKFNILEAINALKNYEMPPGRMRLLDGINKSLIIDDTYNSSPFASESALITLGGVKCSGRKIAVLGDMLELGAHTEETHKNIGKTVSENADILIVVGPRAKYIKEGAVSAGMKAKDTFEFSNSRDAGEFLKTFVNENDIVFIKGSQGMRMERAVDSILLDQANKKRLLVRQEPEWLAKQ